MLYKLYSVIWPWHFSACVGLVCQGKPFCSWCSEFKSHDKGQPCFSEIANESADAADKQVPLTSSTVVDDFYLTDPVTGMLANIPEF